ncbi:MAG: xylulokinase [Elusimicrobia bacterium RIFOXYA2_FULL_39_19]|nr:MAG: xylulokinase [Elusimicrobia bacterium RIFOXYA2_FULL_39_19]
MKYLLGIDIGTSGVKTLLIKEDGTIAGKSTKEYSLETPMASWAQQNPQDWWNAAVESIREVLRQSSIQPSEVTGIGLSGQMHGSVFLDKTGKVLRPCILWCDQRTTKQCEYITKKVGSKKLISLVSNPVLTGFTAGKILWVKENEPKIYKKISKVLLPKDYIRYKLTGVYATEVSDASGTLLLDVKKRKWSKELLDILEIPLSWMPDCYESTFISASINEEAAFLTGLKKSTPVAGGGGDQAAGAVGSGVVEPGIISVTIGTSGVVFAYSDKPKTDLQGRVHTFCHAVPDKWHVMGVMLSAGGAFQWFRNNIGTASYNILTDNTKNIPAGSEGLIFLPYLSGERTPHCDPYARGVFFGLTLKHTKEHMAKAVLEGVGFGLKDSLEILRSMKIPVKQIRVSGGGAKSMVWMQILADIFGAELVTINTTEGAAYGAALLAGVGTKVYKSIKEACEKTINVTGRITPNKKNTEIYKHHHLLFTSLYKGLKNNFKSI